MSAVVKQYKTQESSKHTFTAFQVDFDDAEKDHQYPKDLILWTVTDLSGDLMYLSDRESDDGEKVIGLDKQWLVRGPADSDWYAMSDKIFHMVFEVEL